MLNIQLDLERKFRGHQRFNGSAPVILRRIQEKLWNGQFIQGSLGHFRQLWVRDLGFFTEAYRQTGQEERLLQSWSWALFHFERQNRITTTIWPSGRAYDIFEPSADSLPLMLWSLKKLGSDVLLDQYEVFLKKQAALYFKTRLEASGLPSLRKDYSGMKDAVKRKGSLYTFYMGWLLAKMTESLGWSCAPTHDWEDLLMTHFWSEKLGYFFEDRKQRNYMSSDVNLIGFYLGLLPLDQRWDRIMNAIEERELAKPLALRHGEARKASSERIVERIFAPNYQGDTIWANVGMIYLSLLNQSRREEARAAIERWCDRVEQDQNFLELFSKEGKAFSTWAYCSDEGMNWSVQLLALIAPETSNRDGVGVL